LKVGTVIECSSRAQATKARLRLSDGPGYGAIEASCRVAVVRRDLANLRNLFETGQGGTGEEKQFGIAN